MSRLRPWAMPLLAAALLAGCASRPLVWERDSDGARASEAELRECHQQAVAQVNRSPVYAFGLGLGFGGWYGPRPWWPGWGLGLGYHPGWSVSRLEAVQDLTAFCMRVRGYRLVELPEPPPSEEAPAAPTDAKPPLRP
ncbi:hypothetical protein [Elioraea sp.]|uniref:hypothetical protein n=1 Tax=Elioraea sp. TaxID=2185103 RepID=UPI0026084C2B|nr:hypothetical protein [Elioraea sp.]